MESGWNGDPLVRPAVGFILKQYKRGGSEIIRLEWVRFRCPAMGVSVYVKKKELDGCWLEWGFFFPADSCKLISWKQWVDFGWNGVSMPRQIVL
jgi:hypothetical protein